MLPEFLLFFGIIILLIFVIFYILIYKKATAQYRQLFELVSEAKLVEQNLLQLLEETKELSETVVEYFEQAVSKEEGRNIFNEQELNKSEVCITPKIDNINNSIILRYEQVKKMHDRGLTVEDIARTMSTGKGEVQLILNLIEKESVS